MPLLFCHHFLNETFDRWSCCGAKRKADGFVEQGIHFDLVLQHSTHLLMNAYQDALHYELLATWCPWYASLSDMVQLPSNSCCWNLIRIALLISLIEFFFYFSNTHHSYWSITTSKFRWSTVLVTNFVAQMLYFWVNSHRILKYIWNQN